MPTPLPEQVRDTLASRAFRMHHYLWHQVRNMWLRYDKETQEAIRAHDWEPPRPALDKESRAILNNHSGEDFLFMHRQIIARVNRQLKEIGHPAYPKIEGWQNVPRPTDPEFPVPPPFTKTNDPDLNPAALRDWKSYNYYLTHFRPWEARFTDPNYLRTVTLGELGAEIEYNIHNRMHMRWAAEPMDGGRPPADPRESGSIDRKWDNPEYAYLGDGYASHVNPIFWKLHGWIDDRINDWMRANNISGEVPWTGTWVGKMPEGAHPESLHAVLGSMAEIRSDHLEEMEEVAVIIARTRLFYHYYTGGFA